MDGEGIKWGIEWVSEGEETTGSSSWEHYTISLICVLYS